MKQIIAIDPATKKLGIAFFDGEHWIAARTLESRGLDRQGRQQELLHQIVDFITEMGIYDIDLQPVDVVCEDPLLKGKANNAIQRLIGALECMMLPVYIHFISPTSMKKAFGSGKLDKREVAEALGAHMETAEEEDMISELIEAEEWDATDAIGIGVTWQKQLLV